MESKTQTKSDWGVRKYVTEEQYAALKSSERFPNFLERTNVNFTKLHPDEFEIMDNDKCLTLLTDEFKNRTDIPAYLRSEVEYKVKLSTHDTNTLEFMVLRTHDTIEAMYIDQELLESFSSLAVTFNGAPVPSQEIKTVGWLPLACPASGPPIYAVCLQFAQICVQLRLREEKHDKKEIIVKLRVGNFPSTISYASIKFVGVIPTIDGAGGILYSDGTCVYRKSRPRRS